MRPPLTAIWLGLSIALITVATWAFLFNPGQYRGALLLLGYPTAILLFLPAALNQGP